MFRGAERYEGMAQKAPRRAVAASVMLERMILAGLGVEPSHEGNESPLAPGRPA